MDLRGQAALSTAEIVVVVGCALVPLPVPAVVPLLIMATISLGLRGQRWAPRFASERLHWVVGAAAGAAALALAYFVVGPILESRGGLVGWSRNGAVRGKPDVFFVVAMLTAVTAVAAEMVMRGWILERVREQVGGRAGVVAGVAVAAIVESVFLGEAGASAFGAALVSVALSAIYLAGGRSLVAPIAARLAFELGALLLEGLKLVN